MSSRGGGSEQPPLQRRIMRTQTAGNIEESTFDSEVVPSSLVEIAPFLRVANEIEKANPRVAYLCRFYAFEKAHRLDPTSCGRGARQFKTALLQRLDRENSPALMLRVEKSDAREMQSFYQHYKKDIQALQEAADEADRVQLTKAHQTANVLSEVLKAVSERESIEIDHEGNIGESRGGGSDQPLPQRRIMRTQTAGNIRESIFDSEVVPSSLVEIAPILCVADEVEEANPRVAYLCRLYAFEKAHRLDPTSCGRGARQFKTALLQRLDRENSPALMLRVEKSDAHEMQSFYQHYKKHIQEAADEADRVQLTKAHQTANVLSEVLKAVSERESIEIDHEEMEWKIEEGNKKEELCELEVEDFRVKIEEVEVKNEHFRVKVEEAEAKNLVLIKRLEAEVEYWKKLVNVFITMVIALFGMGIFVCLDGKGMLKKKMLTLP